MSLKKHENGGLLAPFHNRKTQAGPIAYTLGGYELLMTVVKSWGEERGGGHPSRTILAGCGFYSVRFIILEASWTSMSTLRLPQLYVAHSSFTHFNEDKKREIFTGICTAGWEGQCDEVLRYDEIISPRSFLIKPGENKILVKTLKSFLHRILFGIKHDNTSFMHIIYFN